MITQPAHQTYLTAYPQYAADLADETGLWLQAFRQSAWQEFSSHGFPTIREEEWRYTNLAALNKTLYQPVAAQLLAETSLTAYRLADAWSVVLVNGRLVQSLSRLDGLPDGVSLQSIALALQNPNADLQNLLGKAALTSEHSMIAFNAAWFTDGVWLDVAPGTVLNKTIQIIHIVTDVNALAATRNVLHVHSGAQLEVLETYVGSSETYLTTAVNECFLEADAELTLYKLQAEAAKATHFGGTYVKQARDSRFTQHNFALGAGLARSDIHSDLDFAAECRLNGLTVASQRQHIDNHTRINHNQPQGISREYYKAVLDQRARGVFQGRVVVAEQAQKTDSEMNNRNLLLSADAEVDSKPQLEIYADDVKCSHGLTVGQLDEKSVFYLQSRGIDHLSARHILTFAFANEMLDKVDNPSLKAQLFQVLLTHFPAISADISLALDL
ncbi:Fe-S cluster assembly protein SufD [Methylomonas paludis]|uniref:Fe-S cluster assembly protein SufD n=1 Tax=Methylomonas paludis TaxID=1173101 RepID=A0A975R857_9GAMM|nr:Fe-S cluster assembly protein SufD [Methylomonas paludis]QWF70010.1 Fe-S cluster assembly protein SufD [Methylomonas paludis]